jgi:hypothetical protein
MAPAAALTAQSEQRPSTGDRTKRKELVLESQFNQVLQTLRAVVRQSGAMKRRPSEASNRQFGSFVELDHESLSRSEDPEPLHLGE